MLAVDASHISKKYGKSNGRHALVGITLRIPRGLTFGLIGANGAGKTTFAKILLDLVRPDAGHVRVLGGCPADPEVRARIGYAPAQLSLPDGTAAQFLASVARMKRLQTAPAHIRRQMDRVGLASRLDERLSSFSKGMIRRLGLAAALLGNPELLILDEPTEGLDPLNRSRVRELLAVERNRGVSILINSHNMTDVEMLCERIAILVNGSVAVEGRLHELFVTQSKYRVRFATGFKSKELEARGFLPTDTQGVFSCTPDTPAALNSLLDQARSCGALILEVGREGSGLEALLAGVTISQPAEPPGGNEI